MENIGLKINYLNELGKMIEITDSTELAQRYKVVCDSIEKDLGITKPFSVGDIKVQINTDDVQAIANGIAKKMKQEYAKKWLGEGGAEGDSDTNT